MAAAQAGDAVIHVDVNLRQVDLIVTDAQGHHVPDLEAADFELLEDGLPQRITNFSWVEVTPPPSGARLAALQEKPSLLERFSGTPRFHKTPGNDVLSAPAANLRKEQVRRVITILAGGSPLTVAGRIRKFIDEQAGPGDMVAVRSTQRAVIPIRNTNQVQIRDAMGIFQQFTNDKRQLDAAAERLTRVCFGHGCIADEAAAFAAAIDSMRNLPGRKALLFVGRYRGPVDKIIRQANRAGVVIYVLDPEGVDIHATSLRDAVAPDSERLLAEKTGGRRMLSTSGFDLTASFNEVIEDLSGYYLLGYSPAADDAARPANHKIEVRVRRAGLTVRVRDGRMGSPDPAAAAEAAPSGREEVLEKTLFSTFTQDGVRVRLECLFTASTRNKKKKRTPVVHALLDIDGRDLELVAAEKGKQKLVLDVVMAVFDADGLQATAENKRFTLLFSNSKAGELAHGSVQYRLDAELQEPGSYQVRAAVRDATSGEVGSAYTFLDIPDFNRSKIALSSLVLELPQGAPSVPGARADWNEFAPGATVLYASEAFGVKTRGKPPAPTEFEAEAKLYRGGGPVAGVAPSAVQMSQVEDRWVLSGSLRLPDDLAAGNYMLELLVYDRDAKKREPVAEQWVDVTLLGPG